MTYIERYPALVDLAGYFNEDWESDAPTWEGLIDFYAAHSTPERRRAATSELAMLLNEVDTDEQLADAVSALGFVYLPDPQTDREWLEDVLIRLAGVEERP